MAFFDEMKNRVTQASQSAAKSAKEFSEITRLNGEISDAESRINQLYNQIGYEVYCAYSAHPLPEAADLIEQVNALHDKIENCWMRSRPSTQPAAAPTAAQRSARAWPSVPAAVHGWSRQSLPSPPHRLSARTAARRWPRVQLSAPAAAHGWSSPRLPPRLPPPLRQPRHSRRHLPRHPRSSSPPSPCSSRSSSLPSRQPRRPRSAPAAVSPSRRMRPSASTAAQSWTEPTTYKEHTPHHGRMEWIDRNL